MLAADAGLSGRIPRWPPCVCPARSIRARVRGHIVVCDRGENARVEKSQVVEDAGGVGMILVNTSPNTLNADIHAVPTVHLDNVTGAASRVISRATRR